MEWRNTPSKDGASPSQKLYSRRTRTTLPTSETLYHPEIVDHVADNIKLRRQKAKEYYDKDAKPLPELEVGEQIRLQPQNPRQPWSQGSCIGKVGPRSYLVQTPQGIYRRNRKFIRKDRSLATDTRVVSDIPPDTIAADNIAEPTPETLNVSIINDVSDNVDQAELADQAMDIRPIDKPRSKPDVQVKSTTCTRYGRSVKTPTRYKDYSCN